MNWKLTKTHNNSKASMERLLYTGDALLSAGPHGLQRHSRGERCEAQRETEAGDGGGAPSGPRSVPFRADPRRVLRGSGFGRWGRRWRSRESQRRRRRRCGPGPDTALRPRGSRPRVGARAEALRSRAGQVLGLRCEVSAGTDAGTGVGTDAGTHLGQMQRGQMQRGHMRGRTRGRARGQMRRQMRWGRTHRARTGRGRAPRAATLAGGPPACGRRSSALGGANGLRSGRGLQPRPGLVAPGQRRWL